jgi:hypothetical protein
VSNCFLDPVDQFPSDSSLVQKDPSLLSRILQIFSGVVLGGAFGSDLARSKDILSTRRHAQALLVKLATKHVDMLFPAFADLYTTVG